MQRTDLRDAPGHLVATIRHLSSLMQGELALAKAEIARNLSRAGVGLVFFGVAALVSLVALNVLATALVGYIAAAGLSLGLAATLVGGGLLAIAAGFAFAGKTRLSAEALHPTRTVENLSRDIDSIKEASNA
ncbi:phage holin family protein [uncultured Tateyamaria sp.]|uniref:phage holin family protein n=1 Tax=Tateyamaria sp. 1078 TaxID=3417464 RepID=UPI0026031C35|nr:phage holin family protein [uncultured Tateyamaria sp.]